MQRIILTAAAATMFLASAGCSLRLPATTGAVPTMTEFKFEASKNRGANLKRDVKASITGTDIRVKLPPGAKTGGLIASFEHSGQFITVLGLPQESGETRNDFRRPVLYDVAASYGGGPTDPEGSRYVRQTYTVSVIAPESGGRELLTSFKFKAADNPGLDSDVVADINQKDRTITAKVPRGIPVTSLVAAFSGKGDFVGVANKPVTVSRDAKSRLVRQVSGVTPNDFSKDLVYVVKNNGGKPSKYTVSVAKPISFAVGDTGPAGGTIFYDKGSYSDGWRYLEAAPRDQASRASWGRKNRHLGTSSGLGAGERNTKKIVDELGTGSYAAGICSGLEIGGHTDWFLPSGLELDEMYRQKEKIKGLSTIGFTSSYWSSTESNSYRARTRDFASGIRRSISKKQENIRVRAIRAF